MVRKKLLIIISVVIVIILVGLGALFLAKNNGNPPHTNTTTARDVALSINPCGLLSANERTSLGLNDGELNDRRDKGELAYTECRWHSKTLQVGITVYPEGSLKNASQWEGAPPKPLIVGSHKAQIAQIPTEQVVLSSRPCQLDIQLEINRQTARVSLLVGIPDDTSPKSCDSAQKIAEMVEARLP